MKSLAALRLRGRGDDHPGIVFKLLHPRAEVCRRVLEPDRVQNARLVRQERRSQFANQLLLGIPFGAKSRPLRDTLPVQTGGVAAGMSEFMVKGVVVVLLAVEGGGRRDADNIIRGRVERGESRVVDGTKPGIFHDGSRPFVRRRHALVRRDRRCRDAFGLVEIENIRPPDERNAGGRAVLAQHHLPGFVPLFEDLVIDDRRGFLALLHVAAKVERLPETDPERGLVVRGAEKQGIDSAIGFARYDVLDTEPGLLPRHGAALQLLDKPPGYRLINVAVHSATSFRAMSMADSASCGGRPNSRAMTAAERLAVLNSGEKRRVRRGIAPVHKVPEIPFENGVVRIVHKSPASRKLK